MTHDHKKDGFHRVYGTTELGLIPATRRILKNARPCYAPPAKLRYATVNKTSTSVMLKVVK